MRKRLSVVAAAAVLTMGLLPGTAAAGLWCEQADRVDDAITVDGVNEGAGDACRKAGSAVIGACNKVAGIWGNECGLN
jgi:hypothetical protein